MLRESLVTLGATVGKYRIDARVAEGGMGVFWRALDTKLDRVVGLKTLHTEFAVEPQLRERFINEARALAKLNHPNICVLHDFFEQNEQLYIVMEYIQGETLADIVRHRGALPRSEVVPIFRQILLALDYAHNHGVVHRDIKPSNIMVSEQGMVKVMDFGIAKMVEAPVQLTRTGRKVGSILYMSPEQIREQPVDHRSDIYALGVTLFQVCTGRVPFDATSEYEGMKAHLEDTPPTPRSVNASVTEDLEYVILRAMSKRPEDRFQSAMDMRNALGMSDLDATSDRVSIASGDKTKVDLGGDTPAESKPDSKPKSGSLKRALLIGGVVLASLVALRAGHRMMQRGRETALPSASNSTGVAVPSAETPSTPAINATTSAPKDSLATYAASGEQSVPSGSNSTPTAGALGAAGLAATGGISTATNSVASDQVTSDAAKADTSAALPSNNQAPVAGGTNPASVAHPNKPRLAQKKAPDPSVNADIQAQTQASLPSAPPLALNKYRVAVVVSPGGAYQVDRSGWSTDAGKFVEGPHRIEAMGPGFPIYADKFVLSRDTTIRIDLDLRFAHASDGDLRISARTEQGDFPICRVKVNGADAGALPGLRLPLKQGAYEIELVPPDGLRVDSLQFEGSSFEGARARIKVPPSSRTFARFFLSKAR